jgi:hypothetical protein
MHFTRDCRRGLVAPSVSSPVLRHPVDPHALNEHSGSVRRACGTRGPLHSQ